MKSQELLIDSLVAKPLWSHLYLMTIQKAKRQWALRVPNDTGSIYLFHYHYHFYQIVEK